MVMDSFTVKINLFIQVVSSMAIFMVMENYEIAKTLNI